MGSPRQGNRGHLEGKENWNPDCLLGFEPAKGRFVILQSKEFIEGDVNILRSMYLRSRRRKAEGVMGGGREARGGKVGRWEVLGWIEGGILGRGRQVGRLLGI